MKGLDASAPPVAKRAFTAVGPGPRRRGRLAPLVAASAVLAGCVSYAMQPGEVLLESHEVVLPARWQGSGSRCKWTAPTPADSVVLVGEGRAGGIIGVDLLSHYRVALDFAHGRFAFEGGPESPKLDSPVGTGATLTRCPRRFCAFVEDVLAGSPAASAGLSKGDRVVAINGIPTTMEAESEVGTLLRTLGVRLKFSIVREDQKHQFDIPVIELHP